MKLLTYACIFASAAAVGLAGPAGAATIVGTAGDDVLVGTPGADTLMGLQGDDVLRGLGGDDVLYGGPGSDDLSGGPGVDAVVYSDSPGGVVITLDHLANDGMPGEGDNDETDIEDVYGSAFGDRIIGSAVSARTSAISRRKPSSIGTAPAVGLPASWHPKSTLKTASIRR